MVTVVICTHSRNSAIWQLKDYLRELLKENFKIDSLFESLSVRFLSNNEMKFKA